MTGTITTDVPLSPGQTPPPPRPGEYGPPPSGAVEPPRPRGRAARIFLGPPDNPRWARPALWALLLATAALYLWNLSASGYANDYYAAAVKSGTESWKAWLFGSLDSGNSITVDKPPASLWVMVLFTRILGFSSFAMLLPQALMGVGSVALLYASVRRWSGPAAGLVAGGLLAATPVAALMFRFNNPDALLTLLVTAASYFVIRAIETPVGRKALRWLLFAGVAIGFAFLTKMMQGLVVLPAFALAYLWAGRSGLWTRIWHLLAAGAAVVVSAGWYVALVALWPAGSRPYIGGS
ncbi:MAG TPA: glycosyltransferase family 39 protein, partial [Dermatophilaceae bacterium]